MWNVLLESAAFQAVIWGLVATAIAAAARVYRAKLREFGRRALLYLPPSVRRSLRLTASPSHSAWPVQTHQDHRGRLGWTLEKRTALLTKKRKPTFAIVGALYLDIYLSRVDMAELGEFEFSGLGEIHTDCGGSACWVGRHLWRRWNQRSFLFSRVGKGDPFSRELNERLRTEPWIRDSYLSEVEHVQSGVSAILMQRTRGFSTTLTHKGVLASFEWRPIVKALSRRTRRGAVLYISGYFRTNLCADLSRALRSLSPKVVVCLDHGLFHPGDSPNSLTALMEAFAEELIDIYLCSAVELAQLLKGIGVDLTGVASDEDLLATFASLQYIPRVTMMRGASTDQRATAYALVDRQLVQLSKDVGRPWRTSAPSAKNAFNAAFMYSLVRESGDSDLLAAVRGAGQLALCEWIEESIRSGPSFVRQFTGT